MFTLGRVDRFDQLIKKSRFLAVAGPVSTEQAAKDFISIHADPSAHHNCWAWRLGQMYRFSDDGEPSGTAGKPILLAIDGASLDGVAVVVTRWFGGILLGSGGLMRAYGGTAGSCLKAAGKIALVKVVDVVFDCGFGDLALVKARLAALADVTVLSEIFVDKGAILTVALPVPDAGKIIQMLSDQTSGRVSAADPDTLHAS
ncbi:IMPACT family protein [Pararhizobium sp.]|uniref:IMPACT family protein n=1 Tax=Pararhizobium sp. TaxID=1977563 RepID=UPI002722B0AB|nr:YigZ family protein [Pararhizobium sp.]MDO9416705.1 YigZ family protein [Pararhizobium sp.]